MAIFNDFEPDKINELLKPAKRVLDEDIASLKRWDEQDLIEIWNRIKSSYNTFMEDYSDTTPADIRQDTKSKFKFSMLKIATCFYVNERDIPGITTMFSEKEMQFTPDIEEFKAFDILSVDEIKGKIARSEGKLYEIAKKYAERGYKSMDKLLDDAQIQKDIMFAINKEYKNILKKIEISVLEYIKTHPMGIVGATTEISEAAVKVRESEEKRSAIVIKANEKIEALERELFGIKNDKTSLENKITQLENDSMRKEMTKDVLNSRIFELEKERDRLLDHYSGFESIWNSRLDAIEEKRNELMNTERELMLARDNYKKNLEEENKRKVEDELKKVEDMRNALSEKESELKNIKESLDNERNEIEEKLNALKKISEGAVERLVMADEAKMHELNYIGRFNEKIYDLPMKIYNPIDKKEHTVNSWNVNEKFTQEKQIVEAFRDKMRYSEIIEHLPLGTRSLYKITEKKYKFFGKEETKIVIEASVLNHWKKYGEFGLDTNPAELSELNSLLMRHIDKAEPGNYFHIIGISSPTGWSKKAKEYINSSEFHKNFVDRHVSVCLIDPETGEIFYNPLDERITQFTYLFKPEFNTEKVEKCKTRIKEKLSIEDFLTINEVTEKEKDFDAGIVKKAFHDLEKEGMGKFKFVEGVGLVFKKEL
ncbi:MAG: hypothetical protein A7315_13815 [Candidatus Altiarchaeales archaeon WOR_SM1_79]|nr:MAG: hypothetical protein A7315_13815 [Candidatus Altiarchaeales archaeon WOR_SM1_79]